MMTDEQRLHMITEQLLIVRDNLFRGVSKSMQKLLAKSINEVLELPNFTKSFEQLSVSPQRSEDNKERSDWNEQVEPVAFNQVYRCKIKSRSQINREIPREKQGWWADVSAGQKLLLRQAVQADIDRCSLNAAHSKNPADYMCETHTNGSLVSKIALEYMNPEQNVFAHPPVPYVVEPRTAQPKEPEHSAPHGEPVAWAWFDEEDGRLSGALDYEQPPHYTVPLYTTPPQCPSRSDIKPLTDEQIDAAIKNSKKVDTGYAGWVRDQRREFARAIEVAHGIRPTDFKE